MNISEHLANFISKNLHCKKVFTLTGGGAMFLNDAFGNHKNISSIYCHHEQAASMAAVGYAKLNNIGVCITTTGCGATNALTGLLDAWQDNVPVLFISGQVKSKETSYLSSASLRAFGVQEFNIVPVVKSFTKSVYFVESFEKYCHVIKRLKFDLLEGRPGPVWLDIPMDIQSKVLTDQQVKMLEKQIHSTQDSSLIPIADEKLNILENYIKYCSKPTILVGNGLRLSQYGKGINLIEKIASSKSIPVLSTYLGVDFFRSDCNFYFGTIGLKSSRIANIIINNCDLLITIGSRLATSAIGFDYEKFAPNAKKIIVDIDPEEHKKKTINADLIIEADATEFTKELLPLFKANDYKSWLSKCQKAASQLPIQEVFSSDKSISIYDVVRLISNHSNDNDILVSDAGSSYYVSAIMFSKRKYQRYITSGAQADMGFALPAGIGCAFATSDLNRTHVITGDGSFQLNIQELQTIKTYKQNLTVYVLNNNGYLSIRTTQNNFFKGRQCGNDPSTGVEFPELSKIAIAYGITFFRFNQINKFIDFLKRNKSCTGPQIIEIICPENEEIIPRNLTQKDDNGQLRSAPLTRMYPPIEQSIVNKLTSLGFDL